MPQYGLLECWALAAFAVARQLGSELALGATQAHPWVPPGAKTVYAKPSTKAKSPARVGVRLPMLMAEASYAHA